jgi:hypothetical protein
MLAIKEMEVKGSQITVIVTEMHIMKSSSSDFVVDYVGAFRRGPRLLWVCPIIFPFILLIFFYIFYLFIYFFFLRVFR